MNIAIVGGGIVGLALGYKLSKVKGNKVHVYEKEKEVGFHQSGRNSGVLHCGLAYKPGSLKAKLAVSGIKQMVKYCIDYKIIIMDWQSILETVDSQEDSVVGNP